MDISVIITTRNEEASIARLLDSLCAQTLPPHEIVVCDGGSSDGTLTILERYQSAVPLRVLSAPGANISRGRNLAIGAASGDIIAATDAGVRLSPQWLEELARPWRDASHDNAPDVVAGFFLPDPQGVFETAMGATVLPSLADIDPQRFLPSSRSVAFRRSAWQGVGGYPEWLDYCEDLVFDLALRSAGCRFAFAPAALAYFRPRSSLRGFFTQYYRYARGDGKADLWRRRHAIRYVIYLVAAPLAILLGIRYNIVWIGLALAVLAYCRRPLARLWPQMRSWGMAARLHAIALVPIIRLVGDVAKMLGYPVGVWWRMRRGRSSGS
jgi:glycosyltransferase involved in cell wall biosynthesis